MYSKSTLNAKLLSSFIFFVWLVSVASCTKGASSSSTQSTSDRQSEGTTDSPDGFEFGLRGLNHTWISARELTAKLTVDTLACEQEENRKPPRNWKQWYAIKEKRFAWFTKLDRAIDSASAAHQALLKNALVNKRAQNLVKAFMKRIELDPPPANEAWTRRTLLHFIGEQEARLHRHDPTAVKRAHRGGNPTTGRLLRRLYRMGRIDRRCHVRVELVRAKLEKFCGPYWPWGDDSEFGQGLKGAQRERLLNPAYD